MPPPRNNKNTALFSVQAAASAMRDQPAESYRAALSNVQATRDWVAAVFEECKEQMRVGSREGLSLVAHSELHASQQPAISMTASDSSKPTDIHMYLPVEVIESVQSLKVKELRAELRKRNHGADGLKQDLRDRLLYELAQEYATDCPKVPEQGENSDSEKPLQNALSNVDDLKQHEKSSVNVDGGASLAKESTTEKSESSKSARKASYQEDQLMKIEVEPNFEDNKNDLNVESTASDKTKDIGQHAVIGEAADPDARAMHEKKEALIIPNEPHFSSNKRGDRTTATEGPMIGDAASTEKENVGEAINSFQRASEQSLSDRKRMRSPMKLVQSAVKKLSPAPKIARLAAKLEQATLNQDVLAHNVYNENETSLPNILDEPKSCGDIDSIVITDAILESVPASGEKNTTIQQSQKQSHFPFKSAFSSQAQQTKDARKAKMAEMRGKSKPLASAKPFITSVGFGSAAQVFAGGSKSAAEPEGKKQLLAAQMREKALKKNSGLTSSSNVSKPLDAPVLPELAASTSKGKSTFNGKSESKLKSATGSVSALRSNFAPFSPVVHQSAVAKYAPSPRVSAEEYLETGSPMSTYEMSDYESECDSDSDSNTSRFKTEKSIPSWAQKVNLLPALDRQFRNPELDPDEIFGEILTCDLAAIFDRKKARYQRRTSSGCWSKDEATAHEKLIYKRSIKNVRAAGRNI